MTNLHSEPVDQLFRSEFDRIEVRYNPVHWEQMQTLLAQVPAVEIKQDSSDSNLIKSVLKAKLFWLVIAVLGLGLILLLFNRINKPESIKENKLKPELPTSKQEVSPQLNTSKTWTSTPVETEQGINQIITQDTILKRKAVLDSLGKGIKDTTNGTLDNFIFW